METSEKATPFVIHEITSQERARYRDSPTHSILKTPTAVFTTIENGDSIGRKRLTFADGNSEREGSSESSKSIPKSPLKNGDKEGSPFVEVAVSPVKSIKVSPESWKAFKTYQRLFMDFANETDKTDYTYSRLSPYHNKEIIPGVTMRPNLARSALHSYSTSSSRFSSDISARSSVLDDFQHRMDNLHNVSISKKMQRKQKTNSWWLLVFLGLFFALGVWIISIYVSPPSNSVVVKHLGTNRIKYKEILRRLKNLERSIAVELSRGHAERLTFKYELKLQQSLLRRNFARLRHLIEVTCRKYMERQHETNEKLRMRLEDKISRIQQNWTQELGEFDTALQTLAHDKPKNWSVDQIIKEAIQKYDADKTGMADFALEATGGKVVTTRCTVPWNTTGSDPSIAIRRSVAPGECWAFQGEGRLVIQLAYPTNVTGCSLEHIPPSLHPHGRASSAPKTFELWGLQKEDDESPHLFGSYQFDISRDAETVQYFPVKHPSNSSFTFVELVITSNHGHEYTCLYRIRVHGNSARYPALGINN